jgi:hypothetical protein
VRKKNQESDKLIDPDQGSGPVLGLAVLLGMVGRVKIKQAPSLEDAKAMPQTGNAPSCTRIASKSSADSHCWSTRIRTL